MRKKRQKYTRQSRKVIWVSGNQCIVIIKNKESKERRRNNKKIHLTSAMPRPYGDVSSDFPEILKFGLRMHFNFFSNNFFSEQLYIKNYNNEHAFQIPKSNLIFNFRKFSSNELKNSILPVDTSILLCNLADYVRQCHVKIYLIFLSGSEINP